MSCFIMTTLQAKKTKEKFYESMDDDFDTVKALAAVFDFVKEANKKGGGKKSYELMLEFDKVFNVLTISDEELPEAIKKLVDEREEARKAKNFKKADKLREEIIRKGYILEDSKEGVRVKKI